ncbi:MAG: flagellar filament capping protein FliD [Gammaproteobacteria bacterium]|nr:flagellar filament capping protein FliD [Gammaproteobacteria bacterium]
MASIISTGIGSGLDIAGLVQQLVAAEGQPVQNRLGLQEARAQAQLSAFGTLQSSLAEFRDTLETMKDLSSFLQRKAASSNESVFTVSVDESALPADYSIEVEQLATAQKLTSGEFTDSDTVVGTGTLTISVGDDSFELVIDDTNNTLAGIRDAINSALDNTGVAATIVNADAGSHLILTGLVTGSANAITVAEAGGDGGLDALVYDPDGPPGQNSLTETSAAQDSQVLIDGFQIVGSTNTVTGAIDGVTINLVSEAPKAPEALLVENDDSAVRSTLDKFVETYNTLVDNLDQLTAYNAEAETAAPLLGDATMRSIRDQLRREMSDAINSSSLTFSTLREIGIETQLDGKLSIVEDEISTVLADDFEQVGQFFASSDGYGSRLFQLVDRFLQTDGIIETRTEGLNTTIEDINDQRAALNERLGVFETRLLRQFNALDALVGQLTNVSNFLTQQLASLPTVSGANN